MSLAAPVVVLALSLVCGKDLTEGPIGYAFMAWFAAIVGIGVWQRQSGSS